MTSQMGAPKCKLCGGWHWNRCLLSAPRSAEALQLELFSSQEASHDLEKPGRHLGNDRWMKLCAEDQP